MKGSSLLYCFAITSAVILTSCFGKQRDATYVRGVLVDSTYNQPVPNATIEVGYRPFLAGPDRIEEEAIATTDENGIFSFYFNKKRDKSTYYARIDGTSSRCSSYELIELDLEFREENNIEIKIGCTPINLEVSLEANDSQDEFKLTVIQQKDTLVHQPEFVNPTLFGESTFRETTRVRPYEYVQVHVFHRDSSGLVVHRPYELYCDPNKRLRVSYP